jgi:hypothetical protein
MQTEFDDCQYLHPEHFPMDDQELLSPETSAFLIRENYEGSGNRIDWHNRRKKKFEF